MNIEQLFASLSEADIDSSFASSQEENLFLDFKVVAKPDLSHADDKTNFARALAGLRRSLARSSKSTAASR
jgi:hypothetical protein